MLEKPDHTTPVTGEWLEKWSPYWGFVCGVLIFLVIALGNVLWAVMMMFLLCPLVILISASGARGLLLPKRAAYRMVAAFLVPMILFGGLMHAAGYWVVNLLGGDNAMLFWFFTAAAIAVWTALLAKKQFGPPLKRKMNGRTNG